MVIKIKSQKRGGIIRFIPVIIEKQGYLRYKYNMEMMQRYFSVRPTQARYVNTNDVATARAVVYCIIMTNYTIYVTEHTIIRKRIPGENHVGLVTRNT